MDHLTNLLFLPGLYSVLHIIGVILAMTHWRRHPTASALLLAGALLNLAVNITRLAVQLVLLENGGDFGIFRVLTPVFGVVNWIGWGLILLAVFAGRNSTQRPRSAFHEDDWDIQERKP